MEIGEGLEWKEPPVPASRSSNRKIYQKHCYIAKLLMAWLISRETKGSFATIFMVFHPFQSIKSLCNACIHHTANQHLIFSLLNLNYETQVSTQQ